MVGFVAGLPFMYQMVERRGRSQVPKYLRPRTDTPRLTVGHGGCFSCIYSVRGAGGYQMFGITPMPIFDPTQTTSYLRDFMVFFRPGDIVKFKPIGRDEYDHAVEDVAEGRFAPAIREVRFDLREFQKDIDGYNAKLEGMLHDRQGSQSRSRDHGAGSRPSGLFPSRHSGRRRDGPLGAAGRQSAGRQ